MKEIKWSQKGLKFQYVALNVACWMQKKSWVEISLEKWNVFLTDEFSSENLVLWKRWSSFTRSASSFCRNPIKSCAHVMWAKWWYHAKFRPFLSSGCSSFRFQGHLAKNKSINAWKIPNEVRNGWNFSCGFECCMLDAKKVFSWNNLRKIKCLCNTWVFVWNPCTLNETVQFVHEVHPVFAVILSTLYTWCVGQMIIPCHVSTFSEFICSSF